MGTERSIDAPLKRLTTLRKSLGITDMQIGQELGVAPGWIKVLESGQSECTFEYVLALLKLCDDPAARGFCVDLLADSKDSTVALPHRVIAKENGTGLMIAFPSGRYEATYELDNATLGEFEAVRNTLVTCLGKHAKAEAIVRAFEKAVQLWPTANHSDIWTFIIEGLYLDRFDHLPSDSALDLPQSWKKASGTALERIFVRNYAASFETGGRDPVCC